MFQRFFQPPQLSYFLFGPRGTGKSTWLKHHYPNAFWINLLDPELFRFFLSAPEKLKAVVEEINEKVIIIDEIQKIPELLDVVHPLIEEKKGHQFILTGSSARKLKRHGVNLLGGRALKKHMPPFLASELGKAFNLASNIKLGMLPIVLDSANPQEVLNAYVGIYLKEEVQEEGIVRNIGDFARFLEAMSFSHASVINASNISRECGVARKTVESYLAILEDLLLSFHLDVFHRKAKRSLITHPKFYFFDSGVYYSIRPQSLYDIPSENEGAALEGIVAQHLKAWVDAQPENYQLNFWRTSNQVEVDFVVTGPDCFLAIEVKNGTSIHPSDLRGLEIFLNDYEKATAVLLYRGKHRYKEKNILCCPVEEFLLSIHPDKKLFAK